MISPHIANISLSKPWPSIRRGVRPGLLVACWICWAAIQGPLPAAWAQAQTASLEAPGAIEVEPRAAEETVAAEATGDAVADWGRRGTLLASLTIFVLAVFLGFELITKVPPTLHTPLMSGSNAISGITLVGAIVAAGATSSDWLVPLLGTLAVIMATINAVGGFAVTHRMLAMFRRK